MKPGLSLFGAPTVSYGATSQPLQFERRAQLLVLLALKRNWVARAEVASMLWPDQEDKLAHTNLRKALFRLQSFPWADHVESRGGTLRFDVDTDVSAFESALRERRLTDALALRRGDLLAGFDDGRNDAWSNWLGFERDRLRAVWRSAAHEFLAGDIDPDAGADLAARLLEEDPLDEAALRSYMAWLARMGHAVRARQAYRDYVERLADEMELAPSAELKALHDTLGAAAPPKVAVGVAKTDASFVGRTVELRRLVALLAQDDCRLLCITGPGGVGKTRFAKEVTGNPALAFPDGAVFVPLDDVATASGIGSRLARELGVALSGRAEPIDQVIGFLRGRRVLLVLDNFEQLATEASVLTKLLDACPGLKMLVTSRIRLGVASEWLMPLEGLACPEAEDRDHIEAFDAVRLFVRAAQRVAPGLAPAAEATAIIDICQQVEGLPLALELAASWTRVLSCDAIATELRRGTELLQTADATQPARHASIEAVFDQSWNLLTQIERDALARLSIFRGGFSADAARAVAGASLPVLGALNDKSLLRKDGARLFMHPLVQQLAAGRLADEATGEQAHAAHAAYFHQLLAQLKPTVESGDRAALDLIDTELENCRRAWQWSIAHGQAGPLAGSSRTLLEYCDNRGRPEEGLMLLRQALESPVVRDEPSLQALLLSRVSHLEYRLDRYADAENHAQRALAATRGNRDRATRLQALNVLGSCAYRLGRLGDAKRYFKQTLQAVLPDGHDHWAAATLDHLSLIEKQLGHYAEALRLSLQSLAEHRRIGDSAGEALCLNNLAALQMAMQQNDAAATYLRESLAICERDGLHATRAYILANLTEVSMTAGDLPAAQAYADRAIEVANAAGNRAVSAWARLTCVRLAARRGDLQGARTVLADGLGTVIALGVPKLKLYSSLCFAEILQAQGAASCASSVLDFAADHPSATPTDREEIKRLRTQLLGEVADPPEWAGLELDELLHRILAETKLAYAPLIAALSAARRPA
jgi:predicted ATPase/DNA-binding SARP family transcriptional activator